MAFDTRCLLLRVKLRFLILEIPVDHFMIWKSVAKSSLVVITGFLDPTSGFNIGDYILIIFQIRWMKWLILQPWTLVTFFHTSDIAHHISLLFLGTLYIAHFSSSPTVNNNQTIVVNSIQETSQGSMTAYKGKETNLLQICYLKNSHYCRALSDWYCKWSYSQCEKHTALSSGFHSEQIGIRYSPSSAEKKVW